MRNPGSNYYSITIHIHMPNFNFALVKDTETFLFGDHFGGLMKGYRRQMGDDTLFACLNDS